MEEVWHRPKWLAPLFWLMGKLGFFIPYVGKHIPARVTITAKQNADGQVLHIFNRHLSFPKPFSFNSTMLYDHKKDELAEMMGPSNLLYFTWVAAFEALNTFTFKSSKMAIQLLGFKIWLPRFLWMWLGEVDFRQTANPDDSTTIELAVRLPLFGDFFGYKGRYRVVQER